jgi:hypothetical protein
MKNIILLILTIFCFSIWDFAKKCAKLSFQKNCNKLYQQREN